MSNPVQAWLQRAAAECGSPAALAISALEMKNDNTKNLILGYAVEWQSGIEKNLLAGRTQKKKT